MSRNLFGKVENSKEKEYLKIGKLGKGVIIRANK